MDIEALKRRLKEAESSRDILLHQLMEVVAKIDRYKEELEDNEQYGRIDQ